MDLERAAREIALNAIEEAKRISGLSATALAKSAKVAPSTVNRFLRDPWNDKTVVPTLVTIAKLSAAAGTSWPNVGSLRRDIDVQTLTLALGAALAARREIAPELSVEALAGIIARLYRLNTETKMSESALAAVARDMLGFVEPETDARNSRTPSRKRVPENRKSMRAASGN